MRCTKSFNKGWYFVEDISEVPTRVTKNAEKITLPHTWNARDGQDGGNDYKRCVSAYIKSFTHGELPEGKCRYLEIGAANNYAEVYLNGALIGTHLGGYSKFRVDMTEHLDEENLLVITVDNRDISHAYPSVADFTFYGGLYRGVNVIGVPSSHFELEYCATPAIAVTPRLADGCAEIDVELYLKGALDNQLVRISILDCDGRVVAQKAASPAHPRVTLEINNPHLWQGRHDPYLYTAEASLISGECILDTVKARFGVRSFFVDPERGFFLNGESYPLRGVSRHQDRKDIGNALLPEHHREDVELIRELGASTVRLAHYQQAEEFYDLCDEAGLVVWAEIPYISQHKREGRENTLSQMTELIVQNYNHPSICFWGISNEITMSGSEDSDLIENHRELNRLVKSLDKTRLTAVAAVSMCDTGATYLRTVDLVAYNHYFGWYGGDVSMNGEWFDNFHRNYPDIPIGVSEYGCEALDWHTSTPTQGDYTEEYQAYYHEELIKQLFSRDYLFATYVWNMFDFGADARAEGGEPGQNHKGLVTFDRGYKKDAFYAYKAWLSDEPFVHICSKRYVDRVEDETEIKVYSNQPSVELFVDNQSYATKTSEDHFFTFRVKNVGSQAIAAIAGECKDEARIRKVEKPNEEYILKETGTVLNWFEITSPDGYLSINDRIDVIMDTEEGRAFFTRITDRLTTAEKSDTGAGFSVNPDMLRMLGGFTLLRFLSMSSMLGLELDREELLAINEELNKIKKK
ncbi:MAG: glycoside hydrolase family 2 protein [Clostridia bacterium]|nr:glycoside hydrolase family 2 protein [Clostridia bacterium]